MVCICVALLQRTALQCSSDLRKMCMRCHTQLAAADVQLLPDGHPDAPWLAAIVERVFAAPAAAHGAPWQRRGRSVGSFCPTGRG